jgi:hypothetical protein
MPMTFKIATTIILLSFLGLNAMAQEQVTTCEGDGAGGHVKLVYHFVSPGRYEALTMIYGDRDVLDNPFSAFNHLGHIVLNGSQGITFNAFEYSDDFYVSVPAFGSKIKTTEGKCVTTPATSSQVSFKLKTLDGLLVNSFSSSQPNRVFIHFYDLSTGEELRCGVDIHHISVVIRDVFGAEVTRPFEMCQTNLGGILTAALVFPSGGAYFLSMKSNLEILSQEVHVQEI